jgi:hypothetical protein
MSKGFLGVFLILLLTIVIISGCTNNSQQMLNDSNSANITSNTIVQSAVLPELAQDLLTGEINSTIKALQSYKENIESEAKKGIFGENYKLFPDYTTVLTYIDVQVAELDKLLQKMEKLKEGSPLVEVRTKADELISNTDTLNQYLRLRILPSQISSGLGCLADEVLNGNITFLSQHFNQYPLWITFMDRAKHDKNIYNASIDGFEESWSYAEHDARTKDIKATTYCNPKIDGDNSIISVAVIKMNHSEFTFEKLKEKLEALAAEHSYIDLIVTPENLFYEKYKLDPVVIDCNYKECVITETTGDGQEIVDIFPYLKTFAAEHKSTIILGTLPEQVKIGVHYASISSQVVISRIGKIVAKHRAAQPVFHSQYVEKCKYNQNFCDGLEEAQLSTAQIFTVSTDDGVSFKALLTIGQEKLNDNFVNAVEGVNADIILDSSDDSKYDYESTMLKIQNNTDVFSHAEASSQEGILKDLILTRYADKNIISESAYFITSNAQGGVNASNGAIINADQDAVEELDVTNDYVFGKIKLR